MLHNTVRLYLHSGARGAHQLARLVERVPFSDKAKLEHALLEKAYVEARQLEMCVEALWWMESGGSRGTYSLRIHDQLVARLITLCRSEGSLRALSLVRRLMHIHRISSESIRLRTPFS